MKSKKKENTQKQLELVTNRVSYICFLSRLYNVRRALHLLGLIRLRPFVSFRQENLKFLLETQMRKANAEKPYPIHQNRPANLTDAVIHQSRCIDKIVVVNILRWI